MCPRNIKGLDRAVGIGGDQNVAVDGHAVDDSAVQTRNRNIVQKRDPAARLHLERANGFGIAEAGVEVSAVHGQANAVQGARIGIGTVRAAAHREGADGDSRDVSIRGFR